MSLNISFKVISINLPEDPAYSTLDESYFVFIFL